MGQRGPAPTPSNILQMRGTYRADRHAGAETEAPKLTESPAPPDEFSPLAQRLWREKAKLLIELDLLTDADLASLEGYVLAHERAIEAERVVAIDGRTVPTSQGIKRHPELVTAEKARADMRRYETEFGLTPSARLRMRQPPKPKEPAQNQFGAIAAATTRKPA
jgi:P27 family predicted phage terminase small subunit